MIAHAIKSAQPIPGSPAAVAQSITGRPYLSWSQTQQYSMCPRAFAYKYVERAAPEFVPSSLIFGGAMHEAFARVHEAQMEGSPVPTVEELTKEVNEHFTSELLPVRYGKTETQATLAELSNRMISEFLVSSHSTPAGEAVLIEDRISGLIDPGIPPIEGKVDHVRIGADGGLILRDYKTTRSKFSESKVEEAAPQLRLYATLLNKELEGWQSVNQLEFVTVTKAKAPVVQLHAVRIRPESVDACINQIGEIWHGIQQSVFPARPGWICKSCPYQSICPSAITTACTTDE